MKNNQCCHRGFLGLHYQMFCLEKSSHYGFQMMYHDLQIHKHCHFLELYSCRKRPQCQQSLTCYHFAIDHLSIGSSHCRRIFVSSSNRLSIDVCRIELAHRGYSATTCCTPSILATLLTHHPTIATFSAAMLGEVVSLLIMEGSISRLGHPLIDFGLARCVALKIVAGCTNDARSFFQFHALFTVCVDLSAGDGAFDYVPHVFVAVNLR